MTFAVLAFDGKRRDLLTFVLLSFLTAHWCEIERVGFTSQLTAASFTLIGLSACMAFTTAAAETLQVALVFEKRN